MREAAALSAVVRNWQGQIFRVKGVVATLHTAAGVFLHVFSLFISSPSRANKEKTCTNERFETLLDGGINALILAPSYPSDSLWGMSMESTDKRHLPMFKKQRQQSGDQFLASAIVATARNATTDSVLSPCCFLLRQGPSHVVSSSEHTCTLFLDVFEHRQASGAQLRPARVIPQLTSSSTLRSD